MVSPDLLRAFIQTWAGRLPPLKRSVMEYLCLRQCPILSTNPAKGPMHRGFLENFAGRRSLENLYGPLRT